MKIANFSLAALFFLFAYFQRNDLDPSIYDKPSNLDTTLWLLFYAIIGTVFILLNFKRIPKWYFLLAALACVIEMAVSGPGLYQNIFGDDTFTMTGTSMSAADPRVELTREFFGALIGLAAVAFQWWQTKRAQ